MDVKQFRVLIPQGEHQGVLEGLVVDYALTIRDKAYEKTKAILNLKYNPEWAKLVRMAQGDLETITIHEKVYDEKFRKVERMAVYHATGEVQMYTHGELLPGWYDHARCGWVSHFGEPYLEK